MSERLDEIKKAWADSRSVWPSAHIAKEHIDYLLSLLDRPVCKWTKIPSNRWDGWRTGCGESYQLSFDSAGLSFKWCGYCGGKLEEMIPEDER